jgi:protein-S-isoprenylcysteine O-methyltransferase Ste14
LDRKKQAAIYILSDISRTALVGVLLFWIAWRIDWWAGWAALAAILINAAAVWYIVIRVHPSLLAERFWSRAGVKSWDNVIVFVIKMAQGARYVVSALDFRNGWTVGFPAGLPIVGFLVCLLGAFFFTWAMISNNFFSQIVRVQTDRGHAVATTGPYRFLRHPGYLGAVLFELGSTILLGSVWALIPLGVFGLLFFLRTALEDRTLQAELPGYADFTQRVRYRLLPGIW